MAESETKPMNTTKQKETQGKAKIEATKDGGNGTKFKETIIVQKEN